MTVKELIELIKDYPDKQVVIYDANNTTLSNVSDADDTGEFVQITTGEDYE